MARFKQLYKILKDVVNAMSWDIPITNIVDNGDETYTLEVECTAYLNNCMVFADFNSDKWEVISFVFNESLTVKAYVHQLAFTDTSIKLGAPTFFHGTVRLNNAKYVMTDRKQDILPIIYLYETLNEKKSLSPKDLIVRTARPRIFILMSNKFEDYTQIDYDEQLFNPLSNIESKFTEGLKNAKAISSFSEMYDSANLEQFGYTDRNGILKYLFTGQLSALEMTIPLNINKCGNIGGNC